MIMWHGDRFICQKNGSSGVELPEKNEKSANFELRHFLPDSCDFLPELFMKLLEHWPNSAQFCHKFKFAIPNRGWNPWSQNQYSGNKMRHEPVQSSQHVLPPIHVKWAQSGNFLDSKSLSWLVQISFYRTRTGYGKQWDDQVFWILSWFELDFLPEAGWDWNKSAWTSENSLKSPSGRNFSLRPQKMVFFFRLKICPCGVPRCIAI